jgi:hypothetical protein
MPLQRFFQRNEDFEEPLENRQAYVEQLFKMAHSDGHMDEGEYHFILKVAQRLQIEVNFEILHENLNDISLDRTASKKFGFDLLFDMSWLMLVDGEVDDRELELGMSLGTQLGFPSTNVRQMVLSIGQHKKMGMPPEEIKTLLKQRFGPE